MLQIHKPHARDPKRILRTPNVDACFSICICVFRISHGSTIIHKMQPINTKISKMHRTNAGISISLYKKRGPFGFVLAGFRFNVHENTASARPKFMPICQFVFGRIETNAGRSEPMPGANDFQVADVDNHLAAHMIITRRKIDNRPRLPAVTYISVFLPVLNVRNDAIYHCPDVLMRIPDTP